MVFVGVSFELELTVRSQYRNNVSKKDRNLRFRLNTEIRCFLTVDDVDLRDDTSEISYDGGAVYVVVDDVDEPPVEALLCDVVEGIAKVIDVRRLDIILLGLLDGAVSGIDARMVSSSRCCLLN